MSTESNLWIIGFPKSGNTWVSYLVSYIFNRPFFDFADLKKKPRQNWIAEKTKGTNPWACLEEYENVYKSHLFQNSLPVSPDKDIIIYVYRDPRDVYISYKNFMENGVAKWQGRLIYRLVSFLGKKARIRWFLKKWKAHIYHWEKIATISVNYEQLNNQGGHYLTFQLRKIKDDINPKRVEEAMDLFSFKNMSKGREKGTENKSSFFRKGITGDWKNYLNESENNFFKAVIKEVNEKTDQELF